MSQRPEFFLLLDMKPLHMGCQGVDRFSQLPDRCFRGSKPDAEKSGSTRFAYSMRVPEPNAATFICPLRRRWMREPLPWMREPLALGEKSVNGRHEVGLGHRPEKPTGDLPLL